MFLPPVRKTLYDVKRDRDQKYRDDGRGEHTADDCRAHDLPSYGTCTGRDRKGQHAEDERKRSHQDRTEPQAGSGERRIDNRLAGLNLYLRELHDEDCILGREPDEHDQTDLGVHVVFERTKPERE